jgi:hypothetical protein
VKRKTLNPVVSPEIPVGWPRPWQGMQATETGAIQTRAWLHPGVADGIEQHGDVEATRQASEALGSEPERTEYGKATLSGSLREGNWLGMRAGIAKKSGNADGVKAFTAIDRERANICYPLR